MRRVGYLKLLLLIAVFAMLATPTIAGFTPSARISGQVYLVDGDDTELIGNGHTLTAKRGSTLLDSSAITDGYYSIDIDSDDASDGDDIDLYVDAVDVTPEKTFELDGSETVDVYIDGEPVGCTEAWSCTAWSEWSVCEASSQSRTRTCTDANSCGTTANKPSTTSTQSCGAGGGDGGGGGGGGGTTGKTTVWINESPDADEVVVEDESSDVDAVSDADAGDGSSITGGFIGRLTEPSVIATALATVVIVLGVFFHFRRK